MAGKANVELCSSTFPRRSFDNHFEDQNGVANTNEPEMVETATNQLNGQVPHMNGKDAVIATEPGEIIEENLLAQSMPIDPRYSFNNHLEVQMVDDATPRRSCIYVVPHVIRELNEDAYTPKVVSIGPFHHGNPKLQNMKRIKEIYLEEFTKESQISLDDLSSFVGSLEPQVRACYSEDIGLSPEKLVNVILVDASFIIILFWRCHDRLWDDAVLSKPWLDAYVRDDLLLLENQLPYFIFEELYDRALLPRIRRRSGFPSFLKLTFDFFGHYNKQELDPNQTFTINHFTDLLRFFYLPREKPGRHLKEARLRYNASKLHEAGVKFHKSTSKCLLDLNFSKGVLDIPQITVEDGTQTLFLNILALEICHYPMKSYIADYTLLLDSLINSGKDVNVLVKEGIISHYLADSNEVARQFNGLNKNLVASNFNPCYYDICKNLNDFYENPWNNMKATLRRDYCNTPWQIAASLAGIILLILTLVQTIFSIIK